MLLLLAVLAPAGRRAAAAKNCVANYAAANFEEGINCSSMMEIHYSFLILRSTSTKQQAAGGEFEGKHFFCALHKKWAGRVCLNQRGGRRGGEAEGGGFGGC